MLRAEVKPVTRFVGTVALIEGIGFSMAIAIIVRRTAVKMLMNAGPVSYQSV